ncbi:MAG: hypothetical protein R6T98_16125 [Desulfatiglandales bacterium]
MEKDKKQWQKPELIVLTRSKPEEQVLWFCKTHDPGQGPGGFLGTCTFTVGGLCAAWTNS